jgi:hypothetical protein
MLGGQCITCFCSGQRSSWALFKSELVRAYIKNMYN